MLPYAAEGAWAAFEEIPKLPVAHQVTATSLYGPPIAGMCAHVFLHGVVLSSLLAWIHSTWYRRDGHRLRYFVFVAVAFDFFACVINVVQVFAHTTNQHRDVFTLVLSWPIDAFPPVLAGISETMVQLFLARRASRLFVRRKTLRKWFLGCIYVLCALSCLASAAMTVFFILYCWDFPITFPANLSAVYLANVAAACWLWLSALVDWVLSLSLAIVMQKQIKDLMGINQTTEGAIRRTISMGLQTALYTSVVAILGAITSIAWSADDMNRINIFLSFTYPLSSLYALSMLATLNNRRVRIDRKNREVPTTSISFLASTVTRSVVTVCVETQVEVDTDDHSDEMAERRQSRLSRHSLNGVGGLLAPGRVNTGL